MKLRSILLTALVATTFGAQARELEVGDSVPAITLEALLPNETKETQDVTAPAAGQRFTLISFFQTQCSYCIQDLPHLAELSRDTATTTTTRLIGIDRSEDAIRAFVHEHRIHIQFPVGLDLNRVAKRAFDIPGTPTTFVLDANRKIIFKTIGVITDEEAATIRTLTQE